MCYAGAMGDHFALIYILKSKTELSTSNIKRLLELLSAYSLNVYYMRGKVMVLSDLLSRVSEDTF